eukprot:4569616-Heterocapsa_arctica.AAC.1
MNNREERMKLLRLGAIRLTAEEANEVISEQLHFGVHYMDSPRMSQTRISESVRPEHKIQTIH